MTTLEQMQQDRIDRQKAQEAALRALTDQELRDEIKGWEDYKRSLQMNDTVGMGVGEKWSAASYEIRRLEREQERRKQNG